jgi:hypothetical protein
MDPLSTRHWAWILEDLPALGRTGSTLERQFLQQNATLGHLLQRQVDDASAARHADRADKEFTQVYPQAAVGIQMLCEAATYTNLPPIYKILTNIKKKDAAIAVSHALDERAWKADSTRVSPVVTPELLECFYAFKAGAPQMSMP